MGKATRVDGTQESNNGSADNTEIDNKVKVIHWKWKALNEIPERIS